jgi:hypothetical protein
MASEPGARGVVPSLTGSGIAPAVCREIGAKTVFLHGARRRICWSMTPNEARAILDDYLASLKRGVSPQDTVHSSTSFSLDSAILNA